MKKNILFTALGLLAWAAPLLAQPMEIITYQGRLKDNSLPAAGNYSFAFDLCDAAATDCYPSPDGTQGFQVSNGLFKSTFTLPSVNLFSQPWYLRVSVGGVALSPMERLTFVPYSVYASTAANSLSSVRLSGDTMTGQLTLAGSTLTVTGSAFSVGGSTFAVRNGNVGIGTSSPYPLSKLHVVTGGTPNLENITLESPASNVGFALKFMQPEMGWAVGQNIGNYADGRFQVMDLNASAARLTLLRSGNLGVGSTEPAYLLSVSSGAGEAGNIVVISTGASEVIRMTGGGEVYATRFIGDGSGITGVTGATGTDPNALPKTGGTLTGNLVVHDSTLSVTGGGLMLSSAGAAQLAFTVNPAGASITTLGANPIHIGAGQLATLALDASGNVGVNKDAGPYRLDVGGSANIEGQVIAGGTLTVQGGAFSVGGSTLVAAAGNVGIGTNTPQSRLDIYASGPSPADMVQIWRDPAGVVVSSVSATGSLQAVRFIGDGSGLTGVAAVTGMDSSKLPLAGGVMQGVLDLDNNYLAGVSTITMYAGSIAIVPPGTGGNNGGYGVSIGSNTFDNYLSGVGIGQSARNNYSYGVGVGGLASYNSSFGVGVGYNAYNNYNYGVGVGNTASNNFTYGVGVGYTATNNMNYGVGVGANASYNNDYAVGVGAYSQNNAGYGAALGAYSYASSSGTALGAQAKANAGLSLALGYGTVNNSTGTASFGDYAVYSSSSIGIGGPAQQARLDVLSANGMMAQVWRDPSGVIVSSVNPAGYLQAVKFIGDGSGLTNVAAATGMDATKLPLAGGNMTGPLSIDPALPGTVFTASNRFSVSSYDGASSLGAGDISAVQIDTTAALHVVAKGLPTGDGRVAVFGDLRSNGSVAGQYLAAGNFETSVDGPDVAEAAIGLRAKLRRETAGGGLVGNAYGLLVDDLQNQGGTIGKTYAIYIGDQTSGTQTDPAYSLYASDPNTRTYFAGQVGIGTDTPGYPLDITGNVNASGGYCIGGSCISSWSSVTGAWARNAPVISPATPTDNVLIQSTLTVAGNAFSVDGFTLLVKGGMVGIGASSPGYLLDVGGTIRSATPAGSNGKVILGDGDVAHGMTGLNITSDTFGLITANSGNGGMHLGGYSGAPAATGLYLSGVIGDEAPAAGVPAVRIAGAKRNGAASQALGGSETLLDVVNYSGAGLLTVLGNGNVGVGTASPSDKLHVYGGNVIFERPTGDMTVAFKTNEAGRYADLRLVTGGNQGWSIGLNPADGNSLQFQYYNGAVWTPILLSYAVNGRVGIGTSTPSGLLEVRDVTAANQYLLVLGTGSAGGFVNVSTSGLVGIGYGSPSTHTVLHAQAIAANYTGGEDVMAGLIGSARALGTGPEDVAVGGDFKAEADGSQNLGYLAGLHAAVERTSAGAGVIDTAVGLYIEEPRNSGGPGGFTNTYGLYIATQTSGAQTNLPYAIYSVDKGARAYFAGKTGMGTAAPRYALEVSSAPGSSDTILAVSTGTDVLFGVKGNGEVYGAYFIGNGAGLTNVSASDGTKLPLSGGTLSGAIVINSLANPLMTPGMIITSSGSLQSTGTGHGGVAGNARGQGAVDLQTYRNVTTQVASGANSVIAGGMLNTSSNNGTVVGGGYGNSATGIYAVVSGGYGNTVSGQYATAGGGTNNNVGYDYGVVGGGTANMAYTKSAVVGGDGNSASGGFAFVGGGQTNTAADGWTAVAGGYNNYATQNYSFVGGGNSNRAEGPDSAVLGGYMNKALATFAAVAGGSYNVVSGSQSFIGGGAYNTVTGTSAVVAGGEENKASGMYSGVLGGYFNTASGLFSGVSGGNNNQASGIYTAVLGGKSNSAQPDYSAVGGGFSNSVQGSGTTSVIAGGEQNIIYSGNFGSAIGGGTLNRVYNNGAAAVIAGGYQNYIRDYAWYSAVGGGRDNRISPYSRYSVVGGGINNRIFGSSATIAGGADNLATSTYTFVGGGSGNTAYDQYSSVVGGQNNYSGATGSFVGGGTSNNAGNTNAAIAGGQNNMAMGLASFVGGGASNIVNFQYSVIGGGMSNTVTATADYAFVGAGYQNSVSATHSVLGGGWYNAVSGMEGFIGAGAYNMMEKQHGVIVGGLENKVAYDAYAGFIGGGAHNISTAPYSVVGGGLFNTSSGTYSGVLAGRRNEAAGVASFIGGGEANRASGMNSVIGGGSGNTAFDLGTTVAGGVDNTANESFSFVGGGYQNEAATGYTAIAGGYQNVIGTVGGDGGYSFIGGGYGNDTQMDLTVIGGGETNYISNSGRYAVIGGGLTNRILDTRGAILGGEANLSTAPYSTVGGGLSNTSSGTYSAVMGGHRNVAAGQAAAIAGGENNYAGGIYSFVGGGLNNSAPGVYSAIAGGYKNNTDLGQYAFIGGGQENFAAGYGSVIPGGYKNYTGGNNSFAAGAYSSATAIGSFAWNDSSGGSLLNDVNNQVRFRASGGFWVSTGTVYADPAFFVDSQNRVGIGTAAPGFKLHVRSSDGAVAGLSTSANSTDAAVYGWTNGSATAIKGVAASGYAGRFEGKVYVTDSGINPASPAKLQVNGDLGLGDGTKAGNQPAVVWLQNNFAGTVSSGSIVVVAAAGSFTTTTSAGAAGAIGVVYEPDGITNGAVGRVAVTGMVRVRCNGTAAIGNHVTTSGVNGEAASTPLPTSGTSIGVWMEACTSPAMGWVLLR